MVGAAHIACRRVSVAEELGTHSSLSDVRRERLTRDRYRRVEVSVHLYCPACVRRNNAEVCHQGGEATDVCREANAIQIVHMGVRTCMP